MQGRFFDPTRPDFGPPHAASTGAYLESLAAAYDLAARSGDTSRARIYERTLLRGFRSLLQLQFADEIDLFYIPRRFRKRVKGGVRTTVYDNHIRCDNVQHGLLAAYGFLDAASTTKTK